MPAIKGGRSFQFGCCKYLLVSLVSDIHVLYMYNRGTGVTVRLFYTKSGIFQWDTGAHIS